MSIGTNIKKLRRERDMTQEQLAELLGLTSSAISQWETGTGASRCNPASPRLKNRLKRTPKERNSVKFHKTYRSDM